jgi:AmiR/NasT family two-component response regulator
MESQALGAALAAHASIALITDDRQHQFESALASRDVIGQAKGMIMERFNVDAIRAFEMLRKISQNSNTPVNDVARSLTSAALGTPRRAPL